MPKWQPELIDYKLISGEPGQVNSRTRLMYIMGSRETEMIETITKNNLSYEFNGTSEANGVFNEVSNKFIEIGPNKTKWISHNKFIMSGFMRIIGFLIPGSFRKQSNKYMENFKQFAETR